VFDRGEEGRQAHRKDQHADHLHHGHYAVDPVIGVVGRREPGEVDPRQADRERREDEGGQPDRDVILGQHVGELGRRDAEGDDEGQVEQQLQRRRDAMLLVRVTARHAAKTMRTRRRGRLLRLMLGLIHGRVVLSRRR
jgi:hypothetical protein